MPEYYFLPEIYQNRNRFFNGLRQEETISDDMHGKLFVDEMRMPPWASNSYDLTRTMRTELESQYVRDNIH